MSDPTSVPADIAAMESGVVDGPVRLPWRLFAPAAPGRLPLVVLLHGAGSRGCDNLAPMRLARPFTDPAAQVRNPCWVLAPQMARQWVSCPPAAGCYACATVGISPEMEAMLALVDRLVAERPIDPARIYLTGMSMGGFGTWDALVRRPGRWSAAVPICGAGDPAASASIRDIPLWVWHGDRDDAVPVSGSREMVAALRLAGADPRYSELAGCGHNAWDPALGDPGLIAWLFAQRRATPG